MVSCMMANHFFEGKMKLKRAFTLIELMVVIVIIGILAAIAVPKMFGMSAKAKAAEIGPAASTWSKLEQSYIVETANAGNFVSIGYTLPASTNFTYTNPTATNATEVWQAVNTNVDLNTCLKTTGIWIATITTAAPTPAITMPITNCAILTPNFNLLK